MLKHFQIFSGTIDINFGKKPKMFSKENIRAALSDNSLAPALTYIHNSRITVKFEGNCLKRDKVSFTHRNVVNFCIVYELDTWSRD